MGGRVDCVRSGVGVIANASVCAGNVEGHLRAGTNMRRCGKTCGRMSGRASTFFKEPSILARAGGPVEEGPPVEVPRVV